jgi:hypothetical protein
MASDWSKNSEKEYLFSLFLETIKKVKKWGVLTML